MPSPPPTPERSPRSRVFFLAGLGSVLIFLAGYLTAVIMAWPPAARP